jgi:tRNA pseudouridine38-40 synthase
MRKLKMTLAYDGTEYCGWQIQPDQITVQGTLQAILTEIDGGPVIAHGSGRTDAGVHALGQVASFKLNNPMPAENVPRAMNHVLPESIRVLHVEEEAPDFHASWSAVSKTYEYRIWREEICPPFLSRYVYPHPYPLNEDSMRQAAPLFAGTHDFCSLVGAGGDEKQTTVRTIFSSQLRRDGDCLIYRVCGDGFLYRMVRNIVGTLLDVGRGNLKPDDISHLLKSNQRSEAGATAPARGLFLLEVEY